MGIQLAGGFSDYCLIPDEKYLLDYTGIKPGLAATYMCSGLTAFGALKKIKNVNKDDHILILGLGGVGMMGLQFARALFDCKILAADIDPNKLQAAQGGGADEVYNTNDELSLKKLIEDTKVDVPSEDMGKVEYPVTDLSDEELLKSLVEEIDVEDSGSGVK